MYCPKCGQQQTSEQVRFCSRCGFALDGVKACLADDVEAGAISAHPRQRNINVGVMLMFLGALIVSWITFDNRIEPTGGFLLLGAAFTSLLLFARPLMQAAYKLLSWEEPPPGQLSARRKEMSFGSMLMLAGTILAGFITSIAPPHIEDRVFFFSLITIFVLLLVASRHLMRAVQNLLTDEGTGQAVIARSNVEPHLNLITEGDSALSNAQSAPVTVSGKQRFTTGDLLPPPTITERTTNLLENK